MKNRHRSTGVLLGLACVLGQPLAVGAQTPPAALTATSVAAPTGLAAALAAAWQLQPEQRTAAERDRAQRATREAARRWTPEPPALEFQHTRGRGDTRAQEWETAVVLPLWLPRERDRTVRKADADLRLTQAQRQRAHWELAGRVREAWWAVLRSEADTALAQDRAGAAMQLAADVERRVRAGDLARADAHQARIAQAQADAALAQARADLQAAQAAWKALVPGVPAPAWDGNALPVTEAMPPTPAEAAAESLHPLQAEAAERIAAARQALELVQSQSHANPELTLGAVREREGPGEPARLSWRAGLRWPLGQGAGHEARTAQAAAEAIEAEVALEQAARRATADQAAAHARLQAAQAQQAAAEQRARWAGELQGFVDKAFRLGEADAPTRLRVELEAAEARRALVRSHIEAAAAISQWRQALGLLPN